MDTYLHFLKKLLLDLRCRLLFLPILLSFKITDFNEELVVSYKSLSLKTPDISVGQKQPHGGVL